MTYSPGGSGYPPAQQPGSFGAQPPSYGGPAAEPGPSKLPLYLTAAVAALGLLAYLFSFGPYLGEKGGRGEDPIALEITLVVLPLLAALLAAVSLLPKAKARHEVTAALAVLGGLVLIHAIATKPTSAGPVGGRDGIELKWAFWLVFGIVLLQAIAAVVALLFEKGVLTPPAPRPHYEQPQFGQYGGYYSQPPSQPVAPSAPPAGPRPGGNYPPQQFGGYSGGQPSGGFGAAGPQSSGAPNPPTPPTGYPSFSQPPASGPSSGPASSAPTQQASTLPPVPPSEPNPS